VAAPRAPLAIVLSGDDVVELAATDDHQDRLVPLIDRPPVDGRRPGRTASLRPLLGPGSRCEVEAEGRTIGELPGALAVELHAGLLALAMLEPPYRVVVPLQLTWRERSGTQQVTAAARLDLDELRLLAT
jgi:hypothetical protein